MKKIEFVFTLVACFIAGLNFLMAIISSNIHAAIGWAVAILCIPFTVAIWYFK